MSTRVPPGWWFPSTTLSSSIFPASLIHFGRVFHSFAPRTEKEKTLKSGCLSLLTIRSFSARDGLGLSVRVWLGFGSGVRLGLSILYQMPFSLLKLTMWLCGYSRLKKVGLSILFW
eukprot:sb/3476589/